MTEAPVTEPASLRRNRDFRIVLVSQGVSALGDAVSFTAMPLLVLALTGSGLAMGIVAAITAISDFSFGLLAGAIADRADRKRMMFLADLGRAALTALIPLSVLLDGPTLAVVVIVAAPMAVLRSLFMAAFISSVPGLVGRPHLARANGVVETVATLGFIVGPSIAGALAATIGPGLTLAVDAASFALSSLALVLVRRQLRAPRDGQPTRVIDDIRQGVAYVVHHPVLRSLVLLHATATMALAPMMAALAVRITIELGQSEAVFGAIVTAFGLGAVAGPLAVARLGQVIGLARVLLGGWFLLGAAMIGMAIGDAPVLLVAAGAVEGFAETSVVVAYVTLRAANSPDHLLGRVGSTARVALLGLQPIGLLAGGALIDAASGTAALVVLGAFIAVVAGAFAFFRPLRTATASQEPAVA